MPANAPLASAQAATAAQKMVQGMGAAGLAILLLGTGFSKAAQNIGMAMALLALITGLAWTHRGQWWPVISQDGLFRITVVWILYLVVLALVMAQVYPQAAADHADFAWKLSRLFLIVLVGWWTHISFKSPVTAYWLVLAGVGIGLLSSSHALNWPIIGLETRRLHFWENAQFYGLLMGSTVLLLGFLAPSFIGRRRHWSFFPRLILWLFFLALTVNALLLTGARGAVLGLMVVLVVLTLTVVTGWLRSQRLNLPQGALLLTVLMMAAAVLWLFADQVQQRMASDIATLQATLENPQHIPATSLGIRLYQWQNAAPLVLEHPWFGWGPGAGSYLHEQLQLPEQYRSAGSHFHNSWLDLLLWTGIVGCLLFVGFLGLWSKAVLASMRGTHRTRPLALCAVMVLILFAVAALTQTYFTSQVAWFYLGAFLGPALAFHYKRAARV